MYRYKCDTGIINIYSTILISILIKQFGLLFSQNTCLFYVNYCQKKIWVLLRSAIYSVELSNGDPSADRLELRFTQKPRSQIRFPEMSISKKTRKAFRKNSRGVYKSLKKKQYNNYICTCSIYNFIIAVFSPKKN